MRRRVALIVVMLAMGLGWLAVGQRELTAHAQAPLEIFLTQFNYEESSGQYYVVVSITDPSQVGQLDPRLLDLQTGEDIRFGNLIPVTGAEMEFRLPTDQLQNGKKYKVALRAFQTGTTTYIRRPTSNPAENPLVFTSQEFSYNPPQLAPVAFTVDGVNADFTNHKLQVAMHHSDTTRVLGYEAVVVDKKGGAVGRIERSPLKLNNGIVEAPLPAAIEEANGPTDYTLTFRLFTSDNNRLVGEQQKPFTLPTPPKPSIFDRIGTAFATIPWLGYSLAGIVALIALIYLARAVIPRKEKPLPRPQNVGPIYMQPVGQVADVGGGDPFSSPEAAVAPGGPLGGAPRPADASPAEPTALTVAFDPGDPMILIPTAGAEQSFILNKNEVTVGRSDDNMIVVRDTFVSRRHARIVRQPDGWIWMDRDEVTRPSHINGNLVAGPHPLSDGDEIQIGETTMLFRWGDTPEAADPAATQAASLPSQARAGGRAS